MARRLLLLITDLQIGGTPTVVRELARRLNDTPNVVIDVACLGPRGPAGEQLQSMGVRVTALGARSAGDAGVIFRLARLIRRGKYDTVFSFLVHANAAAAIALIGCRDIRFLQSIQTTQPYPCWHWLAQSVAHHAAECIVVPSPSVALAAGQWADIPPEKIAIIPNAVDIEDFSPRPATEPRGSIGFIGRLDPVKRIPDLLKATQALQGDTHLHLFGEGQERSTIETIVAALGIGDSVTLHGAVAKPQEALRQIDLLVLPSAAEGFGLVLIEAMAAGVPVVATDVPGIRDVVRSGETGLLVPVGRPDLLAAAMTLLLTNRPLRERLINAGRKDVRNRFSWDVVLPLYRSLLRIS